MKLNGRDTGTAPSITAAGRRLVPGARLLAGYRHRGSGRQAADRSCDLAVDDRLADEADPSSAIVRHRIYWAASTAGPSTENVGLGGSAFDDLIRRGTQ